MSDSAAPPRKVALIIAFAALYLIWGSTYLGILFAIRRIPPLLMAGSRFFIAGLIMLAIAFWKGAPRSSFAEWRSAFVVGACLLFFGNGGVTIAEQWVPSGLASLLVATVPIYIAVLDWLSGSAPRPTGLVMLGLAGGFVGIGVLAGPAWFGGPGTGHPHLGAGMFILLFGSLIWSVGSLYSRRISTSASPLFFSGQTMLSGGSLMLLAGLLVGEGRDFHFRNLHWLSLGAFAYLVLVGAIIGYTAYIWLLRHCDPAKVATYAYVNPVVAVLLGAAFADERLTTRTGIAAAIIIGSVALVISAPRPRRKAIATRAAVVAQTK